MERIGGTMLQVALIVCFLLCPTRAVLFGTTGRQGTNSHLFRISTTESSGGILAGFDLGPIKVDNFGVTISGMAFDRTNRILGGKMYAVTDIASNAFPNYLIEVDLATAIGTPVRQLSFSGVQGLAISNLGDVYTWHRGSNPNQPTDVLLKINPDNRRDNGSPVGDKAIHTFLGSGSESSFGMDFNRKTDLLIHFLTANCTYYTVQTSNGDASAVGTFMPPVPPNTSPFSCGNTAFNPDSPFGVTEMWSLEADTSVGNNANTKIAIIDLNSGEAVRTATTNIDDLQTIACKLCDIEMIPLTMPSYV